MVLGNFLLIGIIIPFFTNTQIYGLGKNASSSNLGTDENSSIAMIIAKNIINKFLPLYANMRSNTKFMNQYRQSFLLHGKRIKHTVGGRKKSCKVLGINNDDCALIVEMRNGEIKHITSPTGVIIPKKIKTSKKNIQKRENG